MEEQKNNQENLFEISGIQEQFWILHKLYPQNTAYNIPSVLKIKGKIIIPVLENAINLIVKRHEMLKSCFYEKNNKVFQKVIDNSQVYCKIDIVNVQKPFDENSAKELFLKESHRAFDLGVWPLFRIKLFLYDNDISILTFVFHHSIIDLSSRQVFEKELMRLYNSYSLGIELINLTSANRYSDYSLWLNNWLSTDEARSKIEDWKKEIPQSSEDILRISPDFPRPKIESLDGKRKFFILDPDISLKITKLAKDNSVNAFIVLLAAFSIFLHRLSNQTSVIIGVPLTNRMKAEFTETFGCFVNIVPILVDFQENLTIKEIIAQIRQSMFRNMRKQEVPFVVINNFLLNNRRNSLFQAGFTFDPPMNLSLNNLEIEPLVIERDGAQLDLFATLWEQGGVFSGYMEYSTSLYRESTIIRFIEVFKKIIQLMIENSGVVPAELNIITEQDAELIYRVNNTDAPYEQNLCIHQKLEQQAEENPGLPALLTRERTLSYKELNDHANRMAHFLIDHGINIEDKVAICIDRSIEMMIGIFGTIKAGAAYLPLSPENPTERLKSIINDANPKVIITNKGSSANIPEGSQVVFIDDILQNPLSADSSNPTVKVTSRNLAYVLYTSGSTGIPKGVMIEHHSVLNRLGWMQKAYPIDKSDTILQKTPITFDVSVWELFWWSFNGANLVLLSKGGEKDPDSLIKYISDFKVTTMHFVPSMFTTFFETIKVRKAGDKLKGLRRIFLSGEALPLKQVQEFNEMRKVHSLPHIINLYGPTEATVDVSYFNCPESEINNVYIGRPIDNTKLYVVNNKNMMQPIGVPGELLITGVNLARGYLNNPKLTSEKFFDLKISGDINIKAYHSGDLVKLTPEMEIDYLGRIDNQVKIRGFRVELGDIEAKIHEHPAIKHCAVILADKGGHKYLVAYICLKPGNKIESDKLRSYLSEKLPDYMVPAYIVFLETLPLTSSGKLDRKSLPIPESIVEKRTIQAPTSKYEQRLLDIWKGLLKIDNISVTDNFFDIGGNSLLAINLANLISEEFRITINTLLIFEFPSIKDQSEHLSGDKGDKFSQKNIEIDERMKSKKNVSFKRHR